MSDFGPKCRESKDSKKAPRGRPKKKPDYDREEEIQKLILQAVTLFEEPQDDREERSPDAPSVQAVAETMNTSWIRVRKLLITAGYFSTEQTRQVQALFEQGMDVEQIGKRLDLSRQAVHSMLPYSKGAYYLSEAAQRTENSRVFRKRVKACEKLKIHEDDVDGCKYLWETIQAFEQYPFQIREKQRIKYTIDCDQLCVNKKTYCRQELEEAFHRIRDTIRTNGYVTKETCGCCEELYTIFLRIGACDS